MLAARKSVWPVPGPKCPRSLPCPFHTHSSPAPCLPRHTPRRWKRPIYTDDCDWEEARKMMTNFEATRQVGCSHVCQFRVNKVWAHHTFCRKQTCRNLHRCCCSFYCYCLHPSSWLEKRKQRHRRLNLRHISDNNMCHHAGTLSTRIPCLCRSIFEICSCCWLGTLPLWTHPD